jgi:thymidylate kinase
MIIELFGPAGSGKTTLVNALADLLQNGDSIVERVMSARPGEVFESENVPPLLGSLARMKKIAGALDSQGANDAIGDLLLKLLPPTGFLRTVRLQRYLSILARSWERAREASHVTVFDQGYLSALSSLALYSRFADSERLASCLAVLPKPDLIVIVSAPQSIIDARLRLRMSRLGVVQRLFELDAGESDREVSFQREILRLLPRFNWRTLEVKSLDAESLSSAVSNIVREVTNITVQRQDAVHA